MFFILEDNFCFIERKVKSLTMKVRDSRYELWRIISMFLIVLSHFSLFGNSNVTNFKTTFFEPYGEIGADIFVMISGYFLSISKQSFPKVKFRIAKLWIRTVVYSWIVLFLFLTFHISQITKKTFLQSALPVIFNQYWFITSFIFLMILTPVINLVIRKTNRKRLLIIVIIFLFFSGVQPLYSAFSPFGSFLNVGIMVTCYMTAAYIRKYEIQVNSLLLVLISVTILIVNYVILNFFHFTMINYGICPFIISACLFILITRTKPFHNPVINWAAKSVICTYLMTTHILVTSILWSKWINTSQFSNPVLAGPLIVFIVLLVTILIDQIYIKLEKKAIVPVLKKIFF